MRYLIYLATGWAFGFWAAHVRWSDKWVKHWNKWFK